MATRRRRQPRVADFNTLGDVVRHAADELGATHVIMAGPETRIYFPRGGAYPYEEARVWRKAGYWHAEGPHARQGVSRLPPEAQPIEGSRRRAAAAAPRVQRRLGAARPRARQAPKRDRERYDFFRKQGMGAQTAWDLAAAEEEAEERGWEVTWEDDPEGWDSLGDIDPKTVREVLIAILRDEDYVVLAALGAIVDPDRDYARVVEAELAFEALDREGWKSGKRTR